MSKSKKDWAAERGFDAGAGQTDTAPSTKGSGARRPRTGIGAIYEQAGATLSEQVQELKSRIDAVEGQLDPDSCRRSRFYNRLPWAYDKANPDFASLMESIATTKGNVQLGMVRPIKGDADHRYEIVYGHRRHAACQELGLKFKALIADVDDQKAALFQQMENEGQLPPSPYEKGLALQDIKQQGVYTSMSELATISGQSKTNVYRLLALADLPQAVIDAFDNPTLIQGNWAEPLAQAVEDDRKSVLARAKAIKDGADTLTARGVYNRLIGKKPSKAKKAETNIKIGKRRIARFTTRAGKPAVFFDQDLPKDAAAKLKEFLVSLYQEDDS